MKFQMLGRRVIREKLFNDRARVNRPLFSKDRLFEKRSLKIIRDRSIDRKIQRVVGEK